MTVRVLLVDDHRMVREGLRSVLERDDGFTVVGEATNGREALSEFIRLKPDVVVMDVAMADLNGIEATSQILSKDPAARVVALSSHADQRYIRAMLAAGACGYVLKANAYDELRRAVEAAAAGNKYLCAEITDRVIESALKGLPDTSARSLLGLRELEVLQLIAEGFTSSEIAERLTIATSTVETHRRNIMRKLDIHSVARLTKYAVREGLTSLDGASTPRTL
jgi:DNA-binding NarL/FixJ family response regulator